MIDYAGIWPAETIVVIASGPSLSSADIETVRRAHTTGRCRVIAVNSSFRRAPFADLLYACDADWWMVNRDALAFAGLKASLWAGQPYPVPPGIVRLQMVVGADGQTIRDGLSPVPGYVHHGENSGHQAVNVAAHMIGAGGLIALLGFDMKRGPKGEIHHHPDHRRPLKNPSAAKLEQWARSLNTVAAPLAELGIDIVNCSRRTAVRGIRRAGIETIFPGRG